MFEGVHKKSNEHKNQKTNKQTNKTNKQKTKTKTINKIRTQPPSKTNKKNPQKKQTNKYKQTNKQKTITIFIIIIIINIIQKLKSRCITIQWFLKHALNHTDLGKERDSFFFKLPQRWYRIQIFPWKKTYLGSEEVPSSMIKEMVDRQNWDTILKNKTLHRTLLIPDNKHFYLNIFEDFKDINIWQEWFEEIGEYRQQMIKQ